MKIKQLEWNSLSYGATFYTSGEYRYIISGLEKCILFFIDGSKSPSNSILLQKNLNTLDEAKQYAQQHFEQFIRSYVDE